MMNPNELEGVKNQEVNTENNKKYLPKGLHKVKMVSYQFLEPEKQCPYFSFDVEDEKEYKSTCRIYREREGDKPDTIAWKRESLKRFFQAAGADFSQKDPAKFCQSALNNYFNIVLKEEEYIGYDKTNRNKPVIKSVVKYNFAEPLINEDGVEVSISLKDSYTYKPLDEKDRKRLEFELEEWNNKTETSSDESNDSVDGNDDLPF